MWVRSGCLSQRGSNLNRFKTKDTIDRNYAHTVLPVSWLLSRLRYVSAVRFPIPTGIEPEQIQDYRWACRRSQLCSYCILFTGELVAIKMKRRQCGQVAYFHGDRTWKDSRSKMTYHSLHRNYADYSPYRWADWNQDEDLWVRSGCLLLRGSNLDIFKVIDGLPFPRSKLCYTLLTGELVVTKIKIC